MPTREQTREQNTAAIMSAARARLADVGPGDLSLRSVARDVGMVSSAVYRYFPSRDDLLTALLIECYDELGEAVETADPDGTPLEQWVAACRATRAWALSHRHEYALLYGSPVIGYAAPQDTVVPATRVVFRLVEILMSAAPTPPAPLGRGFEGLVDGAAEAVPGAPPELVGRLLMAWSSLFGTISFELWGHLEGSITDLDAWFDEVAVRLAAEVGIAT